MISHDFTDISNYAEICHLHWSCRIHKLECALHTNGLMEKAAEMDLTESGLLKDCVMCVYVAYQCQKVWCQGRKHNDSKK